MAGLNIGINALRTAGQLINVAGDNVSNASTPGYHVKRASIVPMAGPTISGVRIGLGPTVQDVSRIRSELIERALLMHVQLREKLGEEVQALGHLELYLNEPTEGGLDARLGQFFQSLTELTATPDDLILREQVVQQAKSVCDAFNQLDVQFRNVAESLLNAADLAVGRINTLTEAIANLNQQIKLIETAGTSAPTLKDNRDQLIMELAEIINVVVYDDEYGVVNVSCSGTLLVSGNQNSPLELVITDEGIVIRREGAVGHYLDVREGRLAGILNVANNLVPRYQSIVDELANAFRRALNLVHTTGLGLGGRFHRLEGLNRLTMDTPLDELGYGVPGGTNEKLIINVANESTGEVTQYELILDTTQAANAFIVSLRDDINATVGNLTASVDEGRLILQADDGYAFGFATPYDPNPAEPGDITAVDPTSPSVLDAYTGAVDLAYEFSFLNGGAIGTDAITIQINVREPGGPVLRTLTRQIDATYDPGDVVELENGLKCTLSAGNVAAGDGFSFVARASMDTAGVLDALGLNTLFTGLDAAGIRVVDRIYQSPANLGAALVETPGDNHRLMEMVALQSAEIMAGGSATLYESYRSLLGAIATTYNVKSLQHYSEEGLVNDLQTQRDSVSGVSVDEEMIRLLEGRTMYQGALRFIKIVDQVLAELTMLL